MQEDGLAYNGTETAIPHLTRVRFVPTRAVLSQIVRWSQIPYSGGECHAALPFCSGASPPPRRTALFACTRIVQVPAVITDKTGRYVDGLRARDLTVLDNGVPQQITVDDFGADLSPISLVIAIQSSATSKLALTKIRRVAGMIQPLVTGQRGEAAIVSFDHEIRWLQDFTASDDKIRAAINSVKPGALSGARIFDAIVEIAARTKARPGRKFLF